MDIVYHEACHVTGMFVNHVICSDYLLNKSMRVDRKLIFFTFCFILWQSKKIYK